VKKVNPWPLSCTEKTYNLKNGVNVNTFGKNNNITDKQNPSNGAVNQTGSMDRIFNSQPNSNSAQNPVHDDPLAKSMIHNNGLGNGNQNGQIGVWSNGNDQWTNQKEVEKELEKQSKKRIQDTILIPLNAVGMVIGKKGKNIKIIRKLKQTKLSVFIGPMGILYKI